MWEGGHSQQDQSTALLERQLCPASTPPQPSKAPASKRQHSHCPTGHSYLVKAADKSHDEIHSFLCFFIYRQPAGICQRGRAGRAVEALATGESQGDLPSTQPHAHSPGTAFFLCSSWLEVTGRGAALLELGRPLCPGLMGRKGPEAHCPSLPTPWSPSAVFSWERLCWGWRPAPSCPGIQATLCLSPRTAAVIVPGKRDPGLVQGVLVGPSPAQPHGAPRSPSCSGCIVVVS